MTADPIQAAKERLTKPQRQMLEQVRGGAVQAGLLIGHPRTYESLRDKGMIDIPSRPGLRFAEITAAGRAALQQKGEAA